MGYLLTLFSIPLFVLGSEMIYRGAKRLTGAGVVIGILSILPESIVLLQAYRETQYYIAFASALTSAVVLYTLGLGFIGMAYFMRWGKKIVDLSNSREDLKFVGIGVAVMTALLLYGRIDLGFGLALIALYCLYMFRKFPTYRHIVTSRNRSGLLYVIAGSSLMWFTSPSILQEIETLSAAARVPTPLVALLLFPIASNVQDLLVGLRMSVGDLKSASQAVSSFMVQNITMVTVLLGAFGLMSGMVGVGLQEMRMLLLISALVNLMVFSLASNGDITVKESLAFLLLYLFVPMSFILKI